MDEPLDLNKVRKQAEELPLIDLQQRRRAVTGPVKEIFDRVYASRLGEVIKKHTKKR